MDIYRKYLEKFNEEEIEEFKTFLLSEKTPKIIRINFQEYTPGDKKGFIVKINKNKMEKATFIVNKFLSCKNDEDYENFKGENHFRFLISHHNP